MFLVRRPVIPSGLGGLRAAVIPGQNGLHVRPADWMDLVRRPPTAPTRTSRGARSWLRLPCRIATLNDEFVALHRAILARRARRMPVLPQYGHDNAHRKRPDVGGATRTFFRFVAFEGKSERALTAVTGNATP